MSQTDPQPQAVAQTPHTPHPRGEPAQAEPARLGPAARFSGVLLSPTEAFADVNRKPTIIVPLLITLATIIAGSLAFNAIVRPDWERLTREMIRKNDTQNNRTTPPEVVEQQVKMSTVVGKYFPIIAAAFTPVYYVFVAGVFALALMLMQAKTTFKKILSVILWSQAVTAVVSTIVVIASLLVKDRESLDQINPMEPGNVTATNLAAFLPSDISAPVRAVSASVDIFTIWYLILLTIGLAAISGSKRIREGQTGALVFGLWGLWLLIIFGWGTITSS